MLDDLRQLAGEAVLARLVLLANHVIGAEPAATARLRAHAGRRIALQFAGWPSLLPPLPEFRFAITPAGLIERSSGPEADLRLEVDASNPALAALQSLSGEKPRVAVSGDAALAGDVQWLIDNLRWDVQDDLERLVGPAAARELARVGGGVAAALRQGAQALAGLVRRGDAPR